MRQIRLLAIIFLGISAQLSFAQTDSLLVKKSSSLEDSCELVATSSQKLVCQHSFDAIDSLWQILAPWQGACGFNEPTQRLKILMGIAENAFIDSLYVDYLNYELEVYRNRKDAASKDGYKEIFKDYKAYFGYVPLRGDFDSWTKRFASELKGKQEAKSSAYLFCVLFSEGCGEFDSLLSTKTYRNSFIRNRLDEHGFVERNKDMLLSFSTGAWMPMGKLRYKFNMSPQFGFSVLFPINRTWKLGLGGVVTAFSNNKDLEMSVEDTIFVINPDVGGSIGMWGIKEYRINKDYYINIVSGMGYCFFNTGIEKPGSTEEETSYYNIGTVDLFLGYGIRKRILKTRSIGLNFIYHYTPYNLDRKLVPDIGSSVLTINLTFRY